MPASDPSRAARRASRRRPPRAPSAATDPRHGRRAPWAPTPAPSPSSPTARRRRASSSAATPPNAKAAQKAARRLTDGTSAPATACIAAKLRTATGHPSNVKSTIQTVAGGQPGDADQSGAPGALRRSRVGEQFHPQRHSHETQRPKPPRGEPTRPASAPRWRLSASDGRPAATSCAWRSRLVPSARRAPAIASVAVVGC